MKSYVDVNKIEKIPKGTIFGYRDVVDDSLDDSEHSKYGEVFKSQVEDGVYDHVVIERESDARMLYKKL